MITKTAQQIIDSARPSIRRDGVDVQVLETQLLIWLGENVRALHSMAARLCKSQYTQVATFTVTSGNTVTVGTSPLNGVAATGYLDFRGLDYDIGGGNYQPVKPLPFRERGQNNLGSTGRRYILRGNTIHLFPILNATGVYRLWYLGTVMTPTTPIAATSFDLPEGGDLWLSEAVAARARVRFQEDPGPHQAMQKLFWDEIIKPWLVSRNNADGAVIAQVEDDGDEDWYS